MIAAADSNSGYVVGWGSLALINAGIAQSKARSGLFWFVISLFVGPLATFILVAFVDKDG
jgi:hypothetical protein